MLHNWHVVRCHDQKLQYAESSACIDTKSEAYKLGSPVLDVWMPDDGCESVMICSGHLCLFCWSGGKDNECDGKLRDIQLPKNLFCTGGMPFVHSYDCSFESFQRLLDDGVTGKQLLPSRPIAVFDGNTKYFHETLPTEMFTPPVIFEKSDGSILIVRAVMCIPTTCQKCTDKKKSRRAAKTKAPEEEG